MRYSKVRLAAIGYELAPNVVTSSSLEERLAPAYKALGLQVGQLEAFTGIRERRWWDPGFRLSEGATLAAQKALAGSGVDAKDLGALIYAGVCREAFEPATACAVAENLGVRGAAAVYDISNACLGVLNGIIDAANRIELGQISSALVVSCESARDINEATLKRLLKSSDMSSFKDSLATFTGGSGAVAVLLTAGSSGRRLVGGVHRSAPEHHRLCRWGLENGSGEVMRTDAVSVLRHGVTLGRESWAALLSELSWDGASVDKVVCHQVGSGHQREILAAFAVPSSKDFTTFEFLGNMGTVSLPLTAAIADERGFLASGDKVAFLGIGSGLNCLMLGFEW